MATIKQWHENIIINAEKAAASQAESCSEWRRSGVSAKPQP